jgi:hypothetical protein
MLMLPCDALSTHLNFNYHVCLFTILLVVDREATDRFNLEKGTTRD